jgi:hypothetical protein
MTCSYLKILESNFRINITMETTGQILYKGTVNYINIFNKLKIIYYFHDDNEFPKYSEIVNMKNMKTKTNSIIIRNEQWVFDCIEWNYDSNGVEDTK